MVEISPKQAEQSQTIAQSAPVLRSPEQYSSVKNGVKVTLDDKFVTIEMNIAIAQHISNHMGCDYVKVIFNKDGKSSPDIGGYRYDSLAR